MIGFLEGDVMNVDGSSVLLRVGDVGYYVFPVGFSPQIRDRCEVYVYDHIREDRRELFAFQDRGLQRLFEKLIDISGVGPKLAQKILDCGDAEKIEGYIVRKDISFLTSISGVGKKTAQKIILELQGVLAMPKEDEIDGDVLEALLGLGYTRKDCMEVIGQIQSEEFGDKIREALKYLSGN